MRLTQMLLFSAVVVTAFSASALADACRPLTQDSKPCLAIRGQYELYGTVCVSYSNACQRALSYKMLTSGKAHFSAIAEPGASVVCFRVPDYGTPHDIVATTCSFAER